MWQAAGFLGMSEKTLRETYGHHHPDFLREAADAIASRPTPKKVALVVSLVEEKAKRAGVSKTTANIGGPGRTRTCNQTVMSGRIKVATVGFLEFLVRFGAFVALRCGRFWRETGAVRSNRIWS
jgi:hypothetical protein